MSLKSLNHKGFAAIEAVLIVVVLAIVGGTGYYVYQANSKTTDTQNATQTAANSVVPHKKSATAQGYFTISEWGVRAPYEGKLTLEYKVVSEGTLQFARLSSKQLDSTGTTCKTGGDYGGVMTRYKATDEYRLGDNGLDSGKTAAQYAATLSKSDYGHVGDYYYFRDSPQAACGESSESQDLQTQTAQAFIQILPKLQAVPQ